MTDVKNNKNDLIHSPEDARRLYIFAQEAGGKIGLEVEMALYKPGPNGVQIPESAEMLRMQTELKTKGHDAQLEAAGVLEYASPPMPLSDVAAMAARVTEDLETFESAATRQGYRRAPFSVLPTTTLKEAFDKRVPRERLDVAIRALNDFYGPAVLPIPLLTTGVQASFSPKNAEEMFAMAKRAYALTPLLIAALNSGSGHAENNPERHDVHLRSAYYEPYGSSAGIARSFLHARTAKEYIENHIAAVFDAPMFFCYADATGTLKSSTKDEILTFRRLTDMGLNTQSNYELAESFLYNDLKICNLRDDTGAVIGKRLEVRAPDSGMHQPLSVLLLTAALVPAGPTAQAFEDVLKDYGFTGDPVADAPLLKAARHAAVHHGGRFMDVDFGRDKAGNARSLRDLAADVAGLIVAHYAAEPTLQAAVSHLTDILLTGNCDAKIHAALYPQLSDVTAYLQRGGAAVPKAKNTPQPGLGG